MGIILFAYLPGILGISAIAYLVFTQRRQGVLPYTAFSLCLTGIAFWLLFQMISLLVGGRLATTMVITSVIFSSAMVPFFLVFSLTYQSIRKNLSTFSVVIIFIPAIIFSVLTGLGFVIGRVENDGLRQTVETGILYPLQTVYVVFYVVAGLMALGARVRTLRGAKRSAQILLLVSFGVMIFANLIANYVLKLPQDLVQYLFPITLFITTAIIAYAMMRHKLFDIRLAAVRTAAYGLAIITLAAIYYVLAYLVSVTLFRNEVSSAVSVSPVNILLALVLAFIFQPIKQFFDKITDDIFYRDRYSADDFYTQLNETLTSTTDLRTLLQRASQQIGDTLKSEQAFFYVQYNHHHHVSSGTPHHTALPAEDARRLNDYVKKEGDAIIVTELLPENHEVHRLLISHKIALLMPLTNRAVVLGYLALGDQRSSGYTNRDIKVLKTVSDELVIAIQNALSVQEVKDINVHLQQRIDAATKELKTSNTQLKHLDATKDEFLSMASHQLRTPLTSVKGYLSMVLEGDAGKISDMQRHLLGEAFASSERMVHLIHDFLNVSRLQTGKFMLEQRPIELGKLVDDEVRALQQVAAARNMKIEFEQKGDIPVLNVDENKLQQVVMNYIDNALFYSHETDKPIRVVLQKVDDDVELRVIDNGIGVPKSEQAQLFTKFYRASNARKQRPDGTGVGIYLAKKVVTAHGGEVLFESEEGKGSTFGFRLPAQKLLVETASQPHEL